MLKFVESPCNLVSVFAEKETSVFRNSTYRDRYRKLFRRLRHIAISLPLVAASLLAQESYALDPSRTILQLHNTKWTSREGAPSQVIALAQTVDGFLWIGTSRGLYAFDGVKFERYQPPGNVELPSDNIYTLKASPDGGLWVSFRPSGIGFIKDGKIDVVTANDKLPSSQIYCLAFDGKGRLWAGTHNGLALRQEDGSWKDIGEEWGFAPRRVWSMFTDRSGRMWAAVDGSIVVLTPNVDRFQETGERVSPVTSFSESPDGRVWRSEVGGFVRPTPHSANVSPGFGVKASRIVGSILFDRDGGLWFTDEHGVKRLRSPEILKGDLIEIDDPRIEVFETGDNLSGPLLEDREGNIWIGSPQGLSRFRYSYFTPHSSSSRYRNMTLAADSERGIWIGSSLNLPLVHFDGESARPFPQATSISSVSRVSEGVVWWGADSHLFRQAGNVITPFAPPAHLKGDWLWEVFHNDAGSFQWVNLGDQGLVSFDNGKWGTWTRPTGLPDRGPSASFREDSGRTWLGYTENRVALLEQGVGKLFTLADGIDVGRVRVIRSGHDRIWIGGERGLSIFDGNRFHKIQSAERLGTVSGIVFSRDGSMWLNEAQGIVRIAKEDVDRIIQNPAAHLSFRRFDFEDGLPGSPQMNWTVSSAVEDTDGRIWFATDGGLVSIDPLNLLSNSIPPPVSIRSLVVNDQPYNIHQPIELPKGTEDLSIEYTALSLSIPERVQFRYMLEGVDSEWREANSRREAFYTNLGPGEYRFRVIASNNDGVWNNDGAVLNFQILPRFYQTNWFLGLCGLLAAALALIVVRLRVEQVKNRMSLKFEERLAERGRIAQDLHDTLLQGFVSASMQLDVAVDSLSDKAPEKPRFERIHDMIKRLINDGRETVKGLRSSQTAGRQAFEEFFFQIRDEVDLERSVDFRIVTSGQTRQLHPLIHDEIRHIAHEAIVNAFRHADATRIEVSIEYSARKFFLSIRDNGQGIEPEIVRSGLDGHWGLTGMRERAEKVGAGLKIWSTKGRGTEIELNVPGRLAYEHWEISSVSRLVDRLFKYSKEK